MRLVNSNTFRVEEYLEEETPEYAILSHTWGADSDEVTLSDLNNLASSNVSQSPGLAKLRGACRQARTDGIQYVWVDTCCIDKTNLVELSEAINSMFRWYSRAHVCYAYLSDVPAGDNPQLSGSRFQESRWFQRGWTLQELLAPESMRFYDAGWKFLGSKGKLSASISKATGIPRRFLLGLTSIKSASVARRMSWAAKRRTKRPEDIAYCLLGIFDVSMPMVYGEGRRHAFFRLQEQVIRKIRDDSILAWNLSLNYISNVPDESARPPSAVLSHGKALAESPADFINCGNITRADRSDGRAYELDISGDGVRATLALVEPEPTVRDIMTFAILCCYPEGVEGYIVAFPLVPTSDNSADGGVPNEYIRPEGHPAFLLKIPETRSPMRSIYIRNEEPRRHVHVDGQQPCWFLIEGEDSAFDSIEVEPSSSWHRDRSLISMAASEGNSTSTLIRFCSQDIRVEQDLVIQLKIHIPDNSPPIPQCFAMRSSREHNLVKIENVLQTTPLSRMRQAATIRNRLYISSIISAREANLQNLFILNLGMYPDMASYQTLDLDEVFSKCLARIRSDMCENGEHIRRPTRRRFVKIPCPGLDCKGMKDTVHEWICDACDTYLEYGFTDEYVYCACGRSHYSNLTLKCNLSSHGPEFQAYSQADILEQSLKSLKPGKNYTNILIIGETGVGKSTFVNAFVNYLAYRTLDDAIAARGPEWVIPSSFSTQVLDPEAPRGGQIKEHTIKIGMDPNEVGNERDTELSATQRTTVHVFTIGNRVVRLIDTPAIGDRSWVSDGNRNMDDIVQTLFGYDTLHCILVPVKSNTTRLTSTFSYIVKELLTHFHRTVTANIVFGFMNTRSSNFTPGDSFGTLANFLASQRLTSPDGTPLSLNPSNVYCFDSESFRYLAALKNGIQIGNTDHFRQSWIVSQRETWRLLDHCAAVPSFDLSTTVPIFVARQYILELHKLMVEIPAYIDALDVYQEALEGARDGYEMRKVEVIKDITGCEEELNQVRVAIDQMRVFLAARTMKPYNNDMDALIAEKEATVTTRNRRAPPELGFHQVSPSLPVDPTTGSTVGNISDPRDMIPTRTSSNEEEARLLYAQLRGLPRFGRHLPAPELLDSMRPANDETFYREQQHKPRTTMGWYHIGEYVLPETPGFRSGSGN